MNEHEHEQLIKKWEKDPEFKKAYDELEDEFALFDEMLSARKASGLTQLQVAERMGTKVPAVARLEASGGSKQHSPTLNTLQKYAKAVHCKLIIRLKPMKHT